MEKTFIVKDENGAITIYSTNKYAKVFMVNEPYKYAVPSNIIQCDNTYLQDNGIAVISDAQEGTDPNYDILYAIILANECIPEQLPEYLIKYMEYFKSEYIMSNSGNFDYRELEIAIGITLANPLNKDKSLKQMASYIKSNFKFLDMHLHDILEQLEKINAKTIKARYNIWKIKRPNQIFI